MRTKRFTKHIVCLMMLILVTVGLQACKEQGADDGRLRVVSTTGMVHDLVLNIGQNKVDAVALMGPGIDPHLYKASEGDVHRLSTADIIFYNGLHLESKMGDVLRKLSKRQPTIAVTKSIDKSVLLADPEYPDLYDPHVWFDIRLWKQAAITVRDALIQADPKREIFYRNNAVKYLAALDRLLDETKEKTMSLPKSKRVLVTAHDAFGYFGAVYDFEVVALQGINTQAEAGTKDVQRLAEFISKNKIRAIFLESTVPVRNIEAVQAAVRSRGWRVKIGGTLYADALGTQGGPAETYVGMMTQNVETIVQALR